MLRAGPAVGVETKLWAGPTVGVESAAGILSSDTRLT